MESDNIVKGFTMSEQMYGLRYMSVIIDGDSSEMATIRQTVSCGIFMNKIECANHTCKTYKSRLEALAKDNPEYRGKGGLTKKAIQRLTVGTRIVITKHSITKNSAQLIRLEEQAITCFWGSHILQQRLLHMSAESICF